MNHTDPTTFDDTVQPSESFDAVLPLQSAHGEGQNESRPPERLSDLQNRLGGHPLAALLQILFACELLLASPRSLTAEQVEALNIRVLFGTDFEEIRQFAALDLFETYYPEQYRAWVNDPNTILDFDTTRFLQTHFGEMRELDLGASKVVLLA